MISIKINLIVPFTDAKFSRIMKIESNKNMVSHIMGAKMMIQTSTHR